MSLYFITGNKNKFSEAKAIIPGLRQLDIDLPELQEINPEKIIAAKLDAARAYHKGHFIVEDTSLYIDCLPGLPGPLIKWFIKTINIGGLFDLCEKYKNHKAEAVLRLGYINNEGKIKFFSGRSQGTIVKPSGKNIFGWDPIFKPSGHEKTFAEMTRAQKNQISMRRQAFEKLKKHLEVGLLNV